MVFLEIDYEDMIFTDKDFGRAYITEAWAAGFLLGLFNLEDLDRKVNLIYKNLGSPYKAFIRDINHLIGLGAVGFTKAGEVYNIFVRLEWATEITESEFFEKTKELPKAKTYRFL